MLVLLCLLFGAVATYMGRDVSFDLKNYHAYNGHAFDNLRLGWDVYPGSEQVYYNPFWDFANERIAALLHSSRAVTFALGALFGISALFLWRILRLLFPYPEDRFSRVFAWGMGLTGMAAISQLGLTFNEIQQSVLLSGSVALMLAVAHKRETRGGVWLLIMAGVLAGAATGAKLTALPMAAGLAAGVLASHGIRERGWFCFVVFVTGAAGGFILTGGFWYWHLHATFGNPVFPYFNDIFQSSYYAHESLRDMRMLPESLLQAVFYPFYWIHPSRHVTTALTSDIRFALVMGLAMLALSKGLVLRVLGNAKNAETRQGGESRVWTGFWVFAVVSYVGWMALFSFYRYLIVLEMMTGIGVLYFLAKIFPERRILRTAVMLLCAILAVGMASGGGVRRGPHTDAFFQASIPSVPENSLVLVMTKRPSTYLIRHFPESTRFGRVPPRRLVYDPGVEGRPPSIVETPQGTLLRQQARDLIVHHPGPVYVLDFGKSIDVLKIRRLAQYGLVCQDQARQEIRSPQDKSGLFLYPATRKKGRVVNQVPEKPAVTADLRLNKLPPYGPEDVLEVWVDIKGQATVDLYVAARAPDGNILYIRNGGGQTDFGRNRVSMPGLIVDGETSILVAQSPVKDIPPGEYHLCAALTPSGLSPGDFDHWEFCLEL